MSVKPVSFRLDADLYAYLKERAAQNHRSASQEVMAILSALANGSVIVNPDDPFVNASPRRGRPPKEEKEKAPDPYPARGVRHPKYRGVVSAGKRTGWRAEWWFDGKRSDLGVYPTDVEAAKAVDDESARRGSLHPCRNFPDPNDPNQMSYDEMEDQIRQVMTQPIPERWIGGVYFPGRPAEPGWRDPQTGLVAGDKSNGSNNSE